MKLHHINREFKFPDKEPKYTLAYIHIGKYVESKTAFTADYIHIFRNIICDYCNALNMEYFYGAIPYKELIDNNVFFSPRTRKVVNPEVNIKQSNYIRSILEQIRVNNHNYYASSIIDEIFKYDDLKVITKTVHATIQRIIRDSNHEVLSKEKNVFISKLRAVLELYSSKKTSYFPNTETPLKHPENTSTEVKKTEENIKEELLTIEETRIYLKTTKPTLHKWRKEGKVIAHSIGNRIYYKKSEIEKSLKILK